MLFMTGFNNGLGMSNRPNPNQQFPLLVVELLHVEVFVVMAVDIFMQSIDGGGVCDGSICFESDAESVDNRCVFLQMLVVTWWKLRW